LQWNESERLPIWSGVKGGGKGMDPRLASVHYWLVNEKGEGRKKGGRREEEKEGREGRKKVLGL